MLDSSPWLERRPAVPLPLGYSMTSGAWSELRIWLADWRICSKLLVSNLTFAPVSFSKTLIASFHDIAVAAVTSSKCHIVSVLPLPSTFVLIAALVLVPLDPPEQAVNSIALASTMAPTASCFLRINYLLLVGRMRQGKRRNCSDYICRPL